MHSEEEIRAAAKAAGCRVIQLRPEKTAFGAVWAGKLSCPDNPSTFRFLVELAKVDEADPVARTVGLSFFKANPEDPEARARALHQWVKEHIWFVRETKETYQSPGYTIHAGAGDCDDHANLVNALAKCAGLKARIVPLVNKQGDVTHAVTQIQIDGVWTFAETTVDAGFGENPQVAARRLGLGRTDIVA